MSERGHLLSLLQPAILAESSSGPEPVLMFLVPDAGEPPVVFFVPWPLAHAILKLALFKFCFFHHL